MAFTERSYNQIVEEVLTNLTGGIVETVKFKVSSLEYELGDSNEKVARIAAVSFIDQDGLRQELIPNIDYFLKKDSNIIVFEGKGNIPQEDSIVTVNYYLEGIKSHITDRNIGSVARTITEVFSREIATVHSELKNIYRSSFLDTASGESLDMLVAILGIKRFKADYATGIVHFKRNTPAPADINIPASTVVSNISDKPIKYLTTEEKILRTGQIEVKVPVRAMNPGSENEVNARVISLMPKPVLGIEKVENPEDTVIGTRDETDEELRTRARRVITGSTTATVEALYLNLMGIPHLSSVNIVDRPKNINGRVDIVVDSSKEFDEVKEKVYEVLSRVKPAGIYVDVSHTQKVYPSYTFDITPGTSLSEEETEKIEAAVGGEIKEYFQALGPGENVLAKRLVAAVIAMDKVYDAKLDPANVRLFDSKSAVLSGRVLLNGDIYVDTCEKVNFKKENLILNFLGTKEGGVVETDSGKFHIIFIDVSLTLSSMEPGFAFDKAKKIIDSKTKLFFDNLSEGAHYFLNSFFDAMEDSSRRYVIDRQRSSLRAIHSLDGLIVNMPDNNMDEIRKGEEIQVLSVEVKEKE